MKSKRIFLILIINSKEEYEKRILCINNNNLSLVIINLFV